MAEAWALPFVPETPAEQNRQRQAMNAAPAPKIPEIAGLAPAAATRAADFAAWVKSGAPSAKLPNVIGSGLIGKLKPLGFTDATGAFNSTHTDAAGAPLMLNAKYEEVKDNPNMIHLPMSEKEAALAATGDLNIGHVERAFAPPPPVAAPYAPQAVPSGMPEGPGTSRVSNADLDMAIFDGPQF